MIAGRTMGISQRTSPSRGWIPVGWVVLFFVSSFRFTGSRDPGLASSGVASPEIALELAVYAVVGLLAINELVGRRHRIGSPGIWLLVVYGLLAVVFSLWSRVPLFSFVRGAQVVVLALLVTVTAQEWAGRPERASEDWSRIWVAYLWLVMIFSAAGFLWPNWPEGRYTWPGLHPGSTAEFLAIGAIVGLSMLVERGWAIPSRLRRVLPLLVLGMAIVLFLTITRSVTLAFLIAVLTLLLWSSRARFDVRVLVASSLVVLVLIPMVFWPEELFDFVLREGSVEQLFTLTGRTDLWAVALEAIRTEPILGFGYGAGRLILTEQVQWAGTGHNLWVEAAISLGVVGAFLVTAILVWIGQRAIRLQRSRPSAIGNVGLAVTVFVFVEGIAGSTLALPGFALTVVGVVIAGLSSSHLTSSHARRGDRRMNPSPSV